jgi:hypothetical protein
MQYVYLMTEIVSFASSNGGQVLRLSLKDYKGHEVQVLGSPQQQINIQTLRNQMLPMIVLSDKRETRSEGAMVIPDKALVSVVPIEASALQLMLDQGKADQVLQTFLTAP